MSDLVWFNNPRVLVAADKATEFCPTGSMTIEEKLNSIVRLAMYFAVITYFINGSESGVYVLLGALLLTYFVYPANIEKFQLQDFFVSPGTSGTIGTDPEPAVIAPPKKDCVKSTVNNPFGNFDMINDFTDNPNRSAACNLDLPGVRDTVNANFEHNLYKDVDDLFDKNNSQGRFYTMPVTEIVNDQSAFARDLYLVPDGSCKENQLNCAGMYPLSDLRYNRTILIDPNRNPINN